ncbi:hypothetical protein FOL47_010554 [Perkinsus chesapeaki]|uniref:Uncharacterized protein n=1 Tax=Perkinsus chesapeaki TaxID=330153 RepID=A0A7J6L2L2_PERCH|nr:hypothetical protein FOL47_010554 [Perkinsus chesapeaki]
MINDFLETLEPIVSDSESSDGEELEVEKSVSLHMFGGDALKPVERLLVCSGSAAAVRCGVSGLEVGGPVDSLRVDYVPSSSSAAVLTIPNRCSSSSVNRIMWEKLKPKEVVVATTREVSSTRGVDGIVYNLGSAKSEYPALPLGEAIDGPIAEIITQ